MTGYAVVVRHPPATVTPEELRVLRAFRDGFMLDVPIAKDLVRTYYAYGPVLANMIRDVPPARAAARLMLRPAIALAKHAVTAGW